MKRKSHPSARRELGVTLIELLVAVVIGLVVVLAATNVILIGESHKRSTTGNNDTSQSGAFAAYTLDRAIRSAGSGFSQAWDQGLFGCRLSATLKIGGGAATDILPRSGPFPAPFQSFLGGGGTALAGNLRIAPVLIGQNQSAGGSDVLMVMSGNGSAGDVTRAIRSGVAGTDNLRLDNTVGMKLSDLGLVSLAGNTDCVLEQVSSTDTTLNTVGNEVAALGGNYLSSNTNLSTMASSGFAFFSTIGNAAANNVQFQLFGVDANRTLVAYDLLRGGATTATPDPTLGLADGVAEIRAIYGLDTSAPHDNIVDSWVAPTGTYAIANLMTNPVLMRQIVAVRVAIVMRASNYEKNEVTASRPVLFAGTAGELPAVAMTGDDAHFRLRVIDTTIPLRNMLLLPKL